jgi:hypothetical protein
MTLSFSVNIDDKEIVFSYDEAIKSLVVISIDGATRYIICSSGHIKNLDHAKEYAKVLANEYKSNTFWHPV